ncbi:MAG TPA: prepilin-type N-terminal cleavage/methylation domain-containing protein [Deltaproteobacteria bacterium]|nr:prepilin-type N-terminal cleavage/methylation domain-containing protein [Deltaproteobacteria bacterium]
MDRGMSLVEIMVALACCSIVMLGVYRLYILTAATFRDVCDEWRCMQSLRLASLRIHTDMVQRACLMPPELAVRADGSRLLIAGIPVTSHHPGIRPHSRKAPPYYALVQSVTAQGVTLDTTDIDGDGIHDFAAYQGFISDSSSGAIHGGYVQGTPLVRITAETPPQAGDRAVPAVIYSLDAPGLCRNGQLIAESVTSFEPRMTSDGLVIHMKARSHGTTKDMLLSYPVR